MVKSSIVMCALFFSSLSLAISGGHSLSPSAEISDDMKMASHTVVLLNTQNANFHSRCTGTLLTNNIILTAAHCIPDQIENLWVVTSKYEFAVAQRHPVTFTIRHNLFKSFELPRDNKPNYDLALVQFSGDLPAGFIPTSWVNSWQNQNSDFWLMVAGFGETSAQKGDFGELLFGQINVFNYGPQNHFFRADQQSGRGICKGDSGGPAYLKIGDQLFVLGVVSGIENKTVSGGFPNEQCHGISYFNSTIFYQNWIQTNLELLK